MKINQPFALNEIGGRQNQEDSIFPAKGNATVENRFFLVCDGMGGHENGEVASSTVCQSFADFLSKTDVEKIDKTLFEQALSYAYDRLDEKDTGTAGRKMGTTLTFLALRNQGALMAHIGDSRIYQLRKTPAGLTILYRSRDHSYVNDLVEAKLITPEEALTHPKKNVITRAMQPHLDKRCDATITETADVQAGDYFFLCSDGVLESVDDQQLMGIVAADTTAEQKIKAIQTICQGSSRDNFSAYLVEISEGVTATWKQPIATQTGTQLQTAPVGKQQRKSDWKLLIGAVVLLLIAILSAWIIFWKKENTQKASKSRQTEQVSTTPAIRHVPSKPVLDQPVVQENVREQQIPVQQQRNSEDAGKDSAKPKDSLKSGKGRDDVKVPDGGTSEKEIPVNGVN